MILKCDSKWEERIFAYIGDEYSKCLYIYMDLKKYGFNHKDINVWVNLNADMDISAVILTYHNGMHIYSKELVADWNEISDLILQRNPSIICAVEYIIEQLNDRLNFKYSSGFGVVKYLNCCGFPKSERVKLASTDDVEKMAEMLCKNSDDGYTFEERTKQIYERINDNFTRSYVIYNDNAVVAQASTNAEVIDVAIIAGVKVDENYRRQGLATEVVCTLCDALVKEGKKVYLVCYNKVADKLYEKLGFETCEQWGKLYLKNSNK